MKYLLLLILILIGSIAFSQLRNGGYSTEKYEQYVYVQLIDKETSIDVSYYQLIDSGNAQINILIDDNAILMKENDGTLIYVISYLGEVQGYHEYLLNFGIGKLFVEKNKKHIFFQFDIDENTGEYRTMILMYPLKKDRKVKKLFLSK